MNNNPSYNYVLFGENECRGVAPTMEGLAKLVKHWMTFNPNELLSYQSWRSDQIATCFTNWGWAYIPVNTSESKLVNADHTAPRKEFFGKNIISTLYL